MSDNKSLSLDLATRIFAAMGDTSPVPEKTPEILVRHRGEIDPEKQESVGYIPEHIRRLFLLGCDFCNEKCDETGCRNAYKDIMAHLIEASMLPATQYNPRRHHGYDLDENWQVIARLEPAQSGFDVEVFGMGLGGFAQYDSFGEFADQVFGIRSSTGNKKTEH